MMLSGTVAVVVPTHRRSDAYERQTIGELARHRSEAQQRYQACDAIFVIDLDDVETQGLLIAFPFHTIESAKAVLAIRLHDP